MVGKVFVRVVDGVVLIVVGTFVVDFIEKVFGICVALVVFLLGLVFRLLNRKFSSKGVVFLSVVIDFLIATVMVCLVDDVVLIVVPRYWN